MRHLYLLSIGLLFFSMSCFCQIVDWKNDKYWLEAGLGGYSSTDSTGGFSYVLSANLIRNTTAYKLKYLYHEEFRIFGPSPREKLHSIGMLIGKGFEGKSIQIYFSAGVGIIGGVKRGK